ncbi:MAG TPA: efflux RND transporter periplasmic adaptor subunit [Bordetella sp.]|uniref:efflux RND transporter periplasmic adaptor subunit n=1 Tax=Bordetella sp. TaxID=28081 RepID=UPI002ED5C63C
MVHALSSRRALIVVIVAAIAAGLAWRHAHTNGAAIAVAPEAAPVPVRSAVVQRQDMPIYLTGVGTVTANQSVTVKVRVDGELDKVAFTEGQDVKAGQVLAQIDPRPFQAQLQQAVATEARDQAQLANARRDQQRYARLIKEDATTRQQLDTQNALVSQLEAAVQMDAAQVSYAKVQLGYTTITAPIGGRTGVRLVDAGNIVHATDNTGLVVINQIDPISVLFTLPEDEVTQINRVIAKGGPALPVAALKRDTGELLGQGKLLLVNNQIDTTSGTVQLKALLPNPAHALWPGQYVNARLELGVRKAALTVAAQAVQRGQNGTYVYALDAQREARAQPVHIASIQDGIAVIDQGLKAGERVVVGGQYKLRPGLRTVEYQAADAGAAKAGK